MSKKLPFTKIAFRTKNHSYYCRSVAQLVRALARHARGPRFDSEHSYQPFLIMDSHQNTLQDLFIEEILAFLDAYKPSLTRIEEGKPLQNDIETLLRLIHTTGGSAQKLDLEELATYCAKFEQFLLLIKHNSSEISMAQIATVIEGHNLLSEYLNRLKLDKNAHFDPSGHLSKLRLHLK